MEQRKSLLVIGAIFSIVILIAQNNLPMAFAFSYTIVTTTDAQTNDACPATTLDGNGIVWMVCSTAFTVAGTALIEAYTQNGTKIDDFSLGSVTANTCDFQLLPLFASGDLDSVILHDSCSSSEYVKYELSGSIISKIGQYLPPSCSTDQLMSYDDDGFIWFACNTEDKIGVFNPTSMTSAGFSGDLTNAVGIECDLPYVAQRDTLKDYVIIACDTSNNIVQLEVVQSGNTFTFPTVEPDFTLLATALSGASNFLYVDEKADRFVLVDGTNGLDTYIYDLDLGTATIENNNMGSGINQICAHNFYTFIANRIMVCAGDNNVDGFVSNATSFTQVFNIAEFTSDWFGGLAMVGMYTVTPTINFPVIVSNGGLNAGTQQFLRIDGLSGFTGASSGPPSDTDTDGDGILDSVDNCVNTVNPSQTDTDNDGIGDACDAGQIGGIDCTIPANENILLCRLGGDNNFGGIGNVTGSGLLNVACNVIFVSCEDTNPRTNGLGLLAFIASLFVIIGMFYYSIGKEAFHMPIFIWIVIVVALSAFFTITQWIDPIFLVLTIVAVIAMAVPKIISITKGSSTMGSGSTA